jgi:DNA-directed RNA polymerase specialized sigma24 family protein
MESLVATVQDGARAGQMDDVSSRREPDESTASLADPTQTAQQQLIRRAQQGEREAFDELHSLHQGSVFGYIRARVRNDDDAQDVAQRTWIEVWNNIKSFDPQRGSLHAFATRYWAHFMIMRHYSDLKGEAMPLAPDENIEIYRPAFGEAGHPVKAYPDASWDEEAPAEVYTQLLALTFGGPSPPHQLLAFGFTKLLAWPPRRIVAELSDRSLAELAAQLEQAYLHESELPEALVRPAFARLRQALERRFGEVVDEPKTRETYPQLLDRIVGTTTLRDYYTAGDPAAAVTRWWDAVKRRVRSDVSRLGTGPMVALLQKP